MQGGRIHRQCRPHLLVNQLVQRYVGADGLEQGANDLVESLPEFKAHQVQKDA